MDSHADTDRQLLELEARIRRRGRWRGRPVFHQVLEAELASIVAAAEDPGAVRDRVRAMLLQHGHDPDPPAMPGQPAQDFSHLCDQAPLPAKPTG